MSYADMIGENIKNSFNVHDKYKTLTEDQLRDVAKTDRLDFALCAMNIEGDLNVGMMIRSAHLLGAKECIIFGRRRFDRRSLVGADKYTTLVDVAGLTEHDTIDTEGFINWVRNTNYLPVLVEQGGAELTSDVCNALCTVSLIWNKTPLFVFGNEGTGLPEDLAARMSSEGLSFSMIEIPQLGVLRSLNVAAAASIVMWEYSQSVRLSQRGSMGNEMF